MRLNGWQRLWVLIAGVWALVVVTYELPRWGPEVPPSGFLIWILFWWAVPMLGLYGLGWGIAWVRRGFSG